MNQSGQGEKTRLSKVYFIWVIRDFGSAEFFHSLLEAIEAEDTDQRIEIHIYLTAKITEDQMNNILVRVTVPQPIDSTADQVFLQLQDVGADKDAITSLRAPTHFGRPNVSGQVCISSATAYRSHCPSGTRSSIVSPTSIPIQTAVYCE